MSHCKLALLGFGNVGRALAELLLRKQADPSPHTTAYGLLADFLNSTGIASS